MKPFRNLRRLIAVFSCLSLMAVSSCATGSGITDTGSRSPAAATTDTITPLTFTSPAVTHADPGDDTFDATAATTITLVDRASKVSGSGAEVSGDVVRVTQPGTYLLSGQLSDGQVIVNSEASGKVKLVLAGVDLSCSTAAPLVVDAAEQVVVIMAEGTSNRLADTAASASDDDKTDTPTATLFSKSDLTIAGAGALEVVGVNDGAISSEGGLVVLGGDLRVKAAENGILGKEYLVVSGGAIQVEAGGDAMKSDNEASGESGWIQIDDGELVLAAGSQGMDAVGAINVMAGQIRVTKSDEGLQAAQVTIAGGDLAVQASDDGLNATAHTEVGGTEQVEDGVQVTLSGGTVTIVAGADGIDSNGTAIITDATVAINDSAEGGGEGPFDVNGTLIAPGVISFDAAAITEGQRVAVADKTGEVVASFQANAEVASLVVTAPGIQAQETYQVYAGQGASTTSTEGLSKVATSTATDINEASVRMGGPGGRPDDEGERVRGPGGKPGDRPTNMPSVAPKPTRT